MAFATRFPAVLAGVVSFLGGIVVSAQDAVAPPPSPPALLPPASAGGHSTSTLPGSSGILEGGSTVSLLGYVLTIVVIGAAGLTILLRGGVLGVSWGGAKTARKLRIEESRVVGSRQHLVVVEYEGRRVLLGISPGRIDYLCGLEGDGAGSGGFTEALSQASNHLPSRLEGDGKEGAGKEVT